LKAIESEIIARVEVHIARGAHVAEISPEFDRVIPFDPRDGVREAGGPGVSGLPLGIKQTVATESEQGSYSQVAFWNGKVAAVP